MLDVACGTGILTRHIAEAAGNSRFVASVHVGGGMLAMLATSCEAAGETLCPVSSGRLAVAVRQTPEYSAAHAQAVNFLARQAGEQAADALRSFNQRRVPPRLKRI